MLRTFFCTSRTIIIDEDLAGSIPEHAIVFFMKNRVMYRIPNNVKRHLSGCLRTSVCGTDLFGSSEITRLLLFYLILQDATLLVLCF